MKNQEEYRKQMARMMKVMVRMFKGKWMMMILAWWILPLGCKLSQKVLYIHPVLLRIIHPRRYAFHHVLPTSNKHILRGMSPIPPMGAYTYPYMPLLIGPTLGEGQAEANLGVVFTNPIMVPSLKELNE